MRKANIGFLNLFGIFAVCSLLLSFSVSPVKAQEALEAAIDYAMFGGGGLPSEMTDKYNIGAQAADLKCSYDDNDVNLNTDAGTINPLNVSKGTAPLYNASDMATVLAEIGAAPIAKPGLGATGNCGAR